MSREDLPHVSLACALWRPVLQRCALTGMPRCVSVVGFGQCWVAMCEGGEVVVFWMQVLGCLLLEPGPDENQDDLSIMCGGSCVDAVMSWWDLFIGKS